MVGKRVSKMSAGRKDVPVGVKIISVLYYIGAALGLIFGILFIASAGFISSLLSKVPALATVAAGLFVFLGIAIIAFAIFSYFIGRGLWKAQSWARIVAIIIAVLGALSGFSSLISGAIGSGLFNIVVGGLIGWYLLFNKEAKAAFA